MEVTFATPPFYKMILPFVNEIYDFVQGISTITHKFMISNFSSDVWTTFFFLRRCKENLDQAIKIFSSLFSTNNKEMCIQF
jgi:hypothetical protein